VAREEAWPPACSAGIMGEYGAGHTEAAWRVRLHANVRALFAAVWGTSQLVTSVDGINAEWPRGGHLSEANALHLHSDSNPFRDGDAKPLVQGVVSLTATRAGTGGTSVVARSHLLHRRLFASREAQLRREGSHAFVVLNTQERAWLLRQAGCELVHIETEPGDVVLFSSRTIHCGRRAREPTSDWRFATYVCMAPASTLSEADRQRKACVMGLIPWPLKARRHAVWEQAAETTAHPPNGESIKPRFGWDPKLKSALVGVGITDAPEMAKTPEALQLAGVLPYSCDELAPRRSGGQQAADAADLRAKRVKRFSADEDEVIIIDGAQPQPVSKKPKPAADEVIVLD
jgi:ectoine hydroxylase-related dioxygenase (phytanoyl-CoA dioxygenase family)